MRIALICDWYAPRRGGIEAHLDGLALRLARAGHDVHVITSTPGPATNGEPVRVHRLDASRIPWAGVVFQPAAIRQIGDILIRERIELAHAHVSIVAPVGIGGAFEAQRLSLPTVVTFHSFVPATPLWAAIVGRLVGSSRWNATMTAVSSRVVREVRPFAPDARFTVLPNAVDTAFWTPGHSDRRSDAVSLVAAGRLNSKKRPMVLLKVARALSRLSPARPVRLRIAGSGPLAPVLHREVERERLQQFVELVGWRDPAGTRDLLRESDVFLAPAVRESFGLAALEALAVGLPVVAMRQSGIADFLEDGQSGLLVADDSSFVDAALRLVTDDSLRSRMTAHNRAAVPALTWENTLRLHEATYLAAIQSNGLARAT